MKSNRFNAPSDSAPKSSELDRLLAELGLPPAANNDGAHIPTELTIDVRLARVLDELHCPYETNGCDTCFIIVELPNGRSHRVVLASDTAHIGSREMRRVWACAWIAASPPPHDLIVALLEHNMDLVTGSWQLLREDEMFMVVFGIAIPAIVAAEELHAVIGGVAHIADQLEEKVTGTDKF